MTGDREFELRLHRLMTLYQNADPPATTAFVEAVSPLLYRWFLHTCRDRDAAADLLQDTWVRIHRVRHTYRQGEPVLPWLYAIARRTKVDRFRRTRRTQLHEIAVEVLPEPPVSSKSHLPQFDSLVAGLPESQREVVTLLKVAGLSIEEIATVTGSSAGSVKQKAHRAYEKLRTSLAHLNPFSESK